MAPKKPNLVDQLCSVLLCRPNELHIKLLEPKAREQAYAFLKLVQLETTHLRFNKTVKFSGLSYTGARHMMAFRGFLQITVAQYFYAKHRIILTQMDAPCVIQAQNDGDAHFEYYPLEVLAIVTASPEESEACS